MRMVVVLPEPFGPRKPKIVPRLTCIERSRTTTRPPNDLVSPCTSMTMSGDGGDGGDGGVGACAAATAAFIATPRDVTHHALAFAPSAPLAQGATRRPAARRATRPAFPAGLRRGRRASSAPR